MVILIEVQVSVSEVNGAMGDPDVPFLELLESAFRGGGKNGVRRLLQHQPAAKLLSYTRHEVT